MTKRTYEQKLGAVMITWWIMLTLVIMGHWIMDAMGEGSAPVWLCDSMGNRQCGPGEPWIKINTD